MFKKIRQLFPLLFAEERHAGEGGVICTSCDGRVEEKDIVKQGEYTILDGLDVDLVFCRQCSATIKNQLPEDFQVSPCSESERIDMLAERKKNGEKVIVCSFCERDQFEKRYMFAVLRYYQTGKKKKGIQIHPVIHDKLFWATHDKDNPQKVGEVFICGECALGESPACK